MENCKSYFSKLHCNQKCVAPSHHDNNYSYSVVLQSRLSLPNECYKFLYCRESKVITSQESVGKVLKVFMFVVY